MHRSYPPGDAHLKHSAKQWMNWNSTKFCCCFCQSTMFMPIWNTGLDVAFWLQIWPYFTKKYSSSLQKTAIRRREEKNPNLSEVKSLACKFLRSNVNSYENCKRISLVSSLARFYRRNISVLIPPKNMWIVLEQYYSCHSICLMK